MFGKTTIQSFDGLVGIELQPAGIFMTSPNVQYLYDPLLGTRHVRMRRDLHFGEDDPLYHPQPWNSSVGHLAVIPVSRSNSVQPGDTILWWTPRVEEFVPLEGGSPAIALGHIVQTHRDLLYGCVLDIRKRITGHVSGDSWVRLLNTQLKTLRALLDLPASFLEAAMIFSLMQRVCLELIARLDWLSTYQEIFSALGTDTKRRSISAVVGALTDDPLVAEKLFMAGIPVWLVRPMAKKPGIRVDRWVRSLCDAPPPVGIVHSSMDDASPPYPEIFTGPARSPDRFRKMANFIRSLTMTTIYSTLPAENASLTLVVPPPTSGPSRTSPATSDRSAPYTKKPPIKSKAALDRNKFIDVDSDLMPFGISTWTVASDLIGRNFTNTQAIPVCGVDNGYALPDPNIIVVARIDSTRAGLLRTWLKLREILLYRMRSSTFRPLRASQWRRILGLEVVGTSSSTSALTTRAARDRAEMQTLLQDCLNSGDMRVTIDLANLQAYPVKWRNLTLASPGMPPTFIVRQILWELFEVNFRFELIAIDRLSYQTKESLADRQLYVLSCIPHFDGTLFPSDSRSAKLGFASEDLEERRCAFAGLYGVMVGWSGGRNALSRYAEMSGLRLRTVGIEEEELKAVERELVYHYISVFSDIFGRAPLLPHRM